jgi:glutathione S-transferase
MTKLYYTSTSCGAASFIAAFVAGVHLDLETVDLKTHLTASGADFYKINPKGNVPALVLDDGTVLNEGAAVLQYIADQV